MGLSMPNVKRLGWWLEVDSRVASHFTRMSRDRISFCLEFHIMLTGRWIVISTENVDLKGWQFANFDLFSEGLNLIHEICAN